MSPGNMQTQYNSFSVKKDQIISPTDTSDTTRIVNSSSDESTIQCDKQNGHKPKFQCDEKNNNYKPKLSTHEKCIIVLLCLSDLVSGLGFSLPAPFFPRVAAGKGVSLSMVGFIMSSCPVAFCVGSLVFAHLTKSISPKFLYTAGLLMTGGAEIAFGFLSEIPTYTSFVTISFITRIIEGVGQVAFLISSSAVTYQAFPHHLSSVFAARHTFQGMGNIVGPAIGGGLYELGGFGLPFWIVGFLSICLGILISRWEPKLTVDGGSTQQSMFHLLRSIRVCLTLLAINAVRIAKGFVDVTLSQHLETFGISTAMAGLTFVIIFLSDALFVPLWGYLCDKKHLEAPVMVLGTLGGSIAFLIAGSSPLLSLPEHDIWCVFIGLSLFGISFGMVIVPSMSEAKTGAIGVGYEDNMDTSSILAGLYLFVNSLGTVIGASTAGVLVDQAGYGYACTVIAEVYLFVFVMACIFYGFIYHKFKKRSQNYESIEMVNYQQ